MSDKELFVENRPEMSSKAPKVWVCAMKWRSKDQCGPGTQLTEPFSQFNHFFRLDKSCMMAGVQKKLSFENRLTVDIKGLIFTLEPEDNLFFFCWISGAFHSRHLISSSQLQDYFIFNKKGEYVTLTLGCYSSIFTGDLFPCSIDSYFVYQSEVWNHYWFEGFFEFLI